MSVGAIARVSSRRRLAARSHPIAELIVRRVALGVVVLFAVSILVFGATILLPGNAAYAILGQEATPTRLHTLERELHLDRPVVQQYATWAGDLVQGDLGRSLAASGAPVAKLLAPRLENSFVLVALAGIISTLSGCLLGVFAAARRDRASDHALSTVFLTLTALPDFVVAIFLVMLFATNVWHVLPAVYSAPPGESPLASPAALVLPVLTLVVVVTPYVFRMTRAAMIEALETDYAEMAVLKGVSRRRLLFGHVLPNAIPPIVQVIGLNMAYLAAGIVVTENVFNYPGIGQGLVTAVAARDIPVIQAIVLILAAFHILVNIATDVLALCASPRRRSTRQ